MRRSGLNADLGQSLCARRALRERLVEAIHVSDELFDSRVLGADFADLPADRDVHAPGLQPSHCQRELDSLLVVRALLVLERGLREIHERRSIDVDVVKARRDRFARELFHAVYFGDGINGEFLGVDLEVIALDEDRPAKPLAQRGREHDGYVLRRTLIGIGDLRPGDLLNERSDF